MNRANIDKIAKTAADRFFLAKCWDKINNGIQRNIMSYTPFLSPSQQEMTRYLFGDYPGLRYFGGYEDAERKCLVYLPDYFDESMLYSEEGPIRCLRAEFYKDEHPTHRDFLGALTGDGITRDVLGDICISDEHCDFFVCSEIAAYILQNLSSAGRVPLRLRAIPLGEATIPEQNIREIRDTVASVRLDSVIASGFRIGRGLAASYINTGKVAINGTICEKADKAVSEGAKISVRGLGKMKLDKIGNETKKGRISILIHRYM